MGNGKILRTMRGERGAREPTCQATEVVDNKDLVALVKQGRRL